MASKKWKAYQIFPPQIIQNKRREIYDTLVNEGVSPQFTKNNPPSLARLFELYDKIFFAGELSQRLENTRSTVDFKYTTNVNVSTGGHCSTRRSPGGKRCFFTLVFPALSYEKLFSKEEKEILRSGGLNCHDRLECFQLTFEHELIHLIMNLYDQQERGRRIGGYTIKKADPLRTSHGPLFKCMTYTYFGHLAITTEIYSGDITGQLSKEDVQVGQKVQFNFKGQLVHGEVTDKNPKTARVKVAGGAFKVSYTQMKPYNPEDFKGESYILPVFQTVRFFVGQRVKVKSTGEKATIVKVNPKNLRLRVDGRPGLFTINKLGVESL